MPGTFGPSGATNTTVKPCVGVTTVPLGRSLVLRFGAVLLVALALVGLGAAPAFAHAVLEGTEPGAGAQVRRSPGAITLQYSESVEASLGAIRLYDDRGERIDVGRPEHPAGRGNEVRSSVPDLDNGSYVVTWRVVSADAHPIRGAFTFTVGYGAESTKVDSLAGRLLSEQGGDAVVGAAFAIARFGVFAGIVLLIGAAGFLVFVWPGGRSSRRAARLVWTGWIVALGSTLAGFALQGAYAAALPLADALKPSLWADIWDTRYGHVAALRLALLLVAVPVLRALLPPRDRPLVEHPLPSWWRPAAAVVGVGIVATPGLSGHAGTGSQIPLALVADAVHIAGVSLWVGALPVLAYALLPTADLETLKRTVPRYSQLALGCVIAIMVSGSYQSWREVGSLDALTGTDFGRLLLVKLGVFAGLIVVAAFSRDIVNQKYRYDDDEFDDELGDGFDPGVGPVDGGGSAARSEPSDDRTLVSVGAGPAGAPVETARRDDPDFAFDRMPLDDASAARRLRRSVWIEVAIAVVVLAVTALLVNAAPARDANSGPWIGYIKTPTLWFDTNVVPARVGPNDVHFTAITPGGAPKDVLEMTAEATDTERDLGPIDIPLRRLAPGHYFSPGFRFPFAGEWTITVKALVGETEQVTGTAEIPIR
jgi:copper transport protein